MRRLSGLVLVSLVLVIGCRSAADSAAVLPAPAGATAGEQFARLVDDYFEAYFAESPTAATNVGLHEHDSRLEDVSRGAVERSIRSLRGFLQRLDAIDRSQLSFDDSIDARFLEATIRGRLLDAETLETWRNPMMYAGLPGYAVGSLIKREFAPAHDRLVPVVSRLEQIPSIYAAGRQNIANPPKEFTDLAVRMSGGTAGYFDGMVASWARDAAGSDAELLARFERANRRAVDATRQFHQWLQDDVLPRSTGTYAIGSENFSRKLAYEEMVTEPLAEILARGEENLEKDYRAFVATARLIDPTKSPKEVMAMLEDEHPTAEQLIPSVRDSIEQARQFLVDRQIITIPSEVRARVAETPPYARSGSFASMDTPGPFETVATEAYYYVTPVEEGWTDEHKEEHLRLYNPWVVAMINVHEAYPGHYVQFLYAPRFPTKVRKLLATGTNAEGWAHYAEQMMVDEGFGGGDPRYRLAQLQEALLRDVRYVAGIKLHTGGWTVEQAAKLFEEKAFQQPANAYEEARRGAYNPTYLYYTLGKLEILDLREEYMTRKGATLRQFHDAFVAQGALPIPLVREILFRER